MHLMELVFGMDRIHLTQDRYQGLALVKTVMNLQFS
jgi:hypothetical protein